MLEMQRIQIGSGSNAKVFYRPYLADKMRTRAFAGQGLTLPGDFVVGANQWLRYKVGSNMRMQGGGYTILISIPLPPPYAIIEWLEWRTQGWKMYATAMDAIGVRNEPAVALYPPGRSVGLHYSPILESRLYNWRTKAEVLIKVPPNEGGDHAGKFINITYRAKDMAGGVYAIK